MVKLFISAKKESPRMFDHPILELLSRVPWYLPHCLYLPIVGILLGGVVWEGNISLPVGVAWVLGGVLFWTLVEYLFHRFAFHYEPRSYVGKQFHWVVHGVHHDYPSDPNRLVLPPIVSIPLTLFFYGIYRVVLGSTYSALFHSGFMMGYLMYEFVHYWVHHGASTGALFKRLRTWHFTHHFKDAESGFGVSSPLWDIVFRTRFRKNVS